MEMRKLFLLGLISCVLFGRPCLAMESEDQVDVEVEDFDDLPLADEGIERRRTKELVDGLNPDLWGRIAERTTTLGELETISLVSYPAQIGARRSAPVLSVQFPESRDDQEKFTAFWIGFLDLGEEEEGGEDEGLVSGTQAWNDCALWDRYPGLFVREDKKKCLDRFAGFSSTKPPNRVMLRVDCYRYIVEDMPPFGSVSRCVAINSSELERPLAKFREHILGIVGCEGLMGDLLLFPSLEQLEISSRCTNLGALKSVSGLRNFSLTFFDRDWSIEDDDLKDLCGLEKFDLKGCCSVVGRFLEGMSKIKSLTLSREHCQPFEFSRLENLPCLVVLKVFESENLTDIHLQRLRLKRLRLVECHNVTGSCFDFGALRENLCDFLAIARCDNFDCQKIVSLDKLCSLHLDCFSDQSDFLQEMPQLKSLRLFALHELTDADLARLRVYELQLSACGGVTGSCFSQMPNLKEAELENCNGIDPQLVSEEFDVEHCAEEYSGQNKIILRRKRPSEEADSPGEFE